MNRFTERTVSRGRSGARAFAAAPTSTAPPAAYQTADGRMRRPSSAGSTRGRFRSSTCATRELVVPRSIPIARGIHAPFQAVRPRAVALARSASATMLS